MISPEILFEGFDSTSWTNLISLFAPGVRDRIEAESPATDSPEVSAEDTPTGRRGTLLIVESPAGEVLKALHTSRGRIRDLEYTGRHQLGELTEQYRARRGVILREGVVEELTERLSIRLGREDDYLTQILQLLRAFRELEEAGLITVYPRVAGGVPVPANETVDRALDIVLPDGHAMVGMVWDRGQPWTAIALRRRAGLIDRVAGPDLIKEWTGALGGDFRRDYRVVARAVTQHVAPVHFGIYSELRDLREALRDSRPGGWAAKVAMRDIIVHPAPPYVAVALSADAVRAATQTSARLLGGMDLFGLFNPLAQYVRGRVDELTSVSETLGFNPLRALAQALQRSESDDSGDV